ncbi:MAG: hypothetical protein IIA59_13705 [Candidatus Marinimicrobia bacterium]|nr:hypothetical protein [Candidatus Neomarinimicrobiota bacterium]
MAKVSFASSTCPSRQARTAAREAHAVYYADFMQQSWAHLRNRRQQATLVAIEQEIENIRIAWRYLLAQRNSPELLKFVDSIWFVYEIRGWHRAGIDLFDEAIEKLRPVSGEDEAGLVLAKSQAPAISAVICPNT